MTLIKAIAARKRQMLGWGCGIVNISLLIGCVWAWHQEKQQQNHILALVKGGVEQAFTARISESVRALQRLQPEIAASGGDIHAIRRLIDQEITQKGWGLRIAWSDADRLLRVGTVIGTFQTEAEEAPAYGMLPIDLSHRDYTYEAQRAPGTVYVSEIAAHAVSGRSFFAVALGVAEESRYLGCLASIIDVPYLQELLTRASIEGEVGVRVEMPNGVELFDNHREQDVLKEKATTGEGFAISLYVPPYGAELLFRMAPIILLLNIVFFALAYVFYRCFITPLEAISHYVLELPDVQTPRPEEGGDELLKQAGAIRNLLAHYFYTKKEATAYRENLTEAVRLIHGLREGQMGLLSSLGKELEEIFTAISRYAAFMEGQLQDEHGENEVLLEDVKECGLNLKFLANSFYLICAEKLKQPSLPPVPVDIEEALAAVMELVEDSLAMRGIDLSCEMAADIRTGYPDGTRLKHMLWGMFYFAIRYADDNQTLYCRVRQEELRGLCVTLHVPRCLEAYVPVPDTTTETFFPSHRKAQLEQLEQMLECHANMLVIRHFAYQLGGAARIYVTAGNAMPGYTLEITLP